MLKICPRMNDLPFALPIVLYRLRSSKSGGLLYLLNELMRYCNILSIPLFYKFDLMPIIVYSLFFISGFLNGLSIQILPTFMYGYFLPDLYWEISVSVLMLAAVGLMIVLVHALRTKSSPWPLCGMLIFFCMSLWLIGSLTADLVVIN